MLGHVPKLPAVSRHSSVRIALNTFVGATLAAALVAWAAFLLWLAAEIMIAFVRWL